MNVDPADYALVALAALVICTLATIYPAVAAQPLAPGRRAPLRVEPGRLGPPWPKPLVVVEDLHKSFVHMGRTLESSAASTSPSTQGEIVAIVGPSGAGKSTLLHCSARSTCRRAGASCSPARS